jgi:hypothetical protein
MKKNCKNCQCCAGRAGPRCSGAASGIRWSERRRWLSLKPLTRKTFNSFHLSIFHPPTSPLIPFVTSVTEEASHNVEQVNFRPRRCPGQEGHHGRTGMLTILLSNRLPPPAVHRIHRSNTSIGLQSPTIDMRNLHLYGFELLR